MPTDFCDVQSLSSYTIGLGSGKFNVGHRQESVVLFFCLVSLMDSSNGITNLWHGPFFSVCFYDGIDESWRRVKTFST